MAALKLSLCCLLSVTAPSLSHASFCLHWRTTAIATAIAFESVLTTHQTTSIDSGSGSSGVTIGATFSAVVSLLQALPVQLQCACAAAAASLAYFLWRAYCSPAVSSSGGDNSKCMGMQSMPRESRPLCTVLMKYQLCANWICIIYSRMKHVLGSIALSHRLRGL